VLHVVPDDVSEGALFRENIKRLGGTGLTFDLCVLPHQIPKAIALADLAPDVQFILDHCGVPAIKGGAYSRGGTHDRDRRRPNVTAKISGVVAYAEAESWTVETLRPYVEHTIAQFGWDRVVWGSDWPVCTLGGGLSTWVAATHALLAGCSEMEREKLLSGNARSSGASEIGGRRYPPACPSIETLCKQSIDIADDRPGGLALQQAFIDAVGCRLLERHVAVMTRPDPGPISVARVAR
jgi:hypothetical protein